MTNAEPFEVDGIRYWRPDCPTVGCARPMMQLLPDDIWDDDEDRVQMFCSDPPTEEELDLYVKDRILPAT